jgi:large subunit ribosomal protein L30
MRLQELVMAARLKITMKKSRSHRSEKQNQIIDGLGLKKRERSVIREDTPAIRGMIKKLAFMLDVEEC